MNLNNWYGFEKRNKQHSLSKVFTSSDTFTPKTQTELAESYGITKQTMNNYMRMADMIPGGQTVPAFQSINKMDVESSNNFKTPKTEEQLETNIRQRGDVGGSAKKVGLRIKELERIYGIQHGGDRGNQDEKNSSCIKTQTQLATDMGMDVRTLQNYKLLAEMIPELEDLVDTGILL